MTSESGKKVDGVTEGEVRSERGQKGPFHQRDDGFAVLLPRKTSSRVLAGGRSTLARPDSGANTPGLAGPPHNSGEIGSQNHER